MFQNIKKCYFQLLLKKHHHITVPSRSYSLGKCRDRIYQKLTRITHRSITGAISMSWRWSISHTDLLQELFQCRDSEAYQIQIYYRSYFNVTAVKRITYISITGAISMSGRWSVSLTDLLQGLFRCHDGEAYHIQIYYRSYFDVTTVKRITYRSITGVISMSRRWSVSHTDLLQELFQCQEGEAYHIQIYYRSYFNVTTVKRITYRSITGAICEAYHIQIYYRSYFDVTTVKRITYRSITGAISMSWQWSISNTDLLQELFQCHGGEAYHIHLYYRSYFDVTTVKRITYRSITGVISMSRRWSVSHTDLLQELFQCQEGEAYHIQIYYRSYFNVTTVKRITYRSITGAICEAYHIQITYRSITGAISMSRRLSVSHTDLLQELFRCHNGEAYHIQIYYRSYFNVAAVKRITYRSITGAISMSQRLSVSHTDLLQELFRCHNGEVYHIQIYCRSYIRTELQV